MRPILGMLALALYGATALGQDHPPKWTAEIAGPYAHIDAIEVRKRTVFVGGHDQLTERPFIAAAKVGSDDALWRYDYAGGKVDWATIAAQGSRIIGMTSLEWNDPQGTARLVAVDARTGKARWEDYFTEVAYGRPLLIPTKRVTVAIVPMREPPPMGALAIATTKIRGYDTRRGTRLWEVYLGGVAAGEHFTVADAVASNRRLWIAGSVAEGTSQMFVVRCYELRNGILQWEDRFTAPPPEGDTEANVADGWQLAVRGRTLIVAGTYQHRHPWAPILRAYDALDGDVGWTRMGAAEEHAGQIPRAIVLDRTRVFVSWQRIQYDTGPITVSTRIAAYELGTGAVLAELPFEADVRTMMQRGSTMLLGGTYHASRVEPPAGARGFLLAVDVSGGLARSWNVATPGDVDAIDVSRRSVFVANSQVVQQLGLGR